jgi:hypothetical protein
MSFPDSLDGRAMATAVVGRVGAFGSPRMRARGSG